VTVLRERFNRWHVAAGACCVAAAVTVGVPRLLNRGSGSRGADYAVGVPAALGAAACVALMSVLTDRLSRSVPPGDKALRIAEQTITSSLIASALLVPVLFGTGEWRLWEPELTAAWAAAPAVLLAAVIAMPVTKAAVRTAKYETVGRGGSYFFEFVQASAAILSSVANVVLFGEAWTWTYVGALVLLGAGFALFMAARRKQMRAAVALNAKPQGSKIVPSRRSSSVSLSDDDVALGAGKGRLARWVGSGGQRDVAVDDGDVAREEAEAGTAAFGVRRHSGGVPRFIAHPRLPPVHAYRASPSLAMGAMAEDVARADGAGGGGSGTAPPGVASALPRHMRIASNATSAKAIGPWGDRDGKHSGDTPVMTLHGPRTPQVQPTPAASAASPTPMAARSRPDAEESAAGSPARMEFEPTCEDLREKVLGFVDVPLDTSTDAAQPGGRTGAASGRVVGNDAPGVRVAVGLPASGTAAMNDAVDDHGWRIHAATGT